MPQNSSFSVASKVHARTTKGLESFVWHNCRRKYHRGDPSPSQPWQMSAGARGAGANGPRTAPPRGPFACGKPVPMGPHGASLMRVASEHQIPDLVLYASK